ncbi:MAG: NAD(P)-dependent oxidoreductase [Thermoplasmata archaeon]|nr:NAD(P)-dependent oxidoreductase [Thermoplasmata archaeon]
MLPEHAPSGSPPVGFIGLGQMGSPIALRLANQGTSLVVHTRTRASAEAVLAAGARWAETPKEVGRLASGSIVFTSLPDGRAVRSVLFGRNGVAAGARAGTVLVDLSTVAPEESRAWAERLARRGVHFLDIPLGGSTDAAAAGKLLLYVGGDATVLERVRPLLDKFGRRVERLGPVGAGSAMKLVTNLVGLTTVALDSEALALAEGFGLDRKRTIDLLLDGAGHSIMLERKRVEFEERRYPSKFRLPLARKDIALVEKTARAIGASSRLAREARRMMEEAIAAGHGPEDFSVVFEAALARNRPAASVAEVPTSTPSSAPDGRTPS